MTNISNERWAVTKDIIDIKKMREYYEETYTHNFGIIDETDQYLPIYKILKLTQDEIAHFYSLTTIKKLKL